MNCIPNYIHTADEVLQHLSFFMEGFRALGLSTGARMSISTDAFFCMLLRVAQMPDEQGVVVYFTSKNGKPLGYIVAFDCTEYDNVRTAVIYAAYSNGKYSGGPQDGVAEIERWAKRNGYVRLHAQSRRMSGAATRLFRKKLGFTPVSIVFQKELE